MKATAVMSLLPAVASLSAGLSVPLHSQRDSSRVSVGVIQERPVLQIKFSTTISPGASIRVNLIPLEGDVATFPPLVLPEEAEGVVKAAVFARNFATSFSQQYPGVNATVRSTSSVRTKAGDVLNVQFLQGLTDTLFHPALVGPLTLGSKPVGSTAVFFLQWWKGEQDTTVTFPLPPDEFLPGGQLVVMQYDKEVLVWSDRITWQGSSR